MDKQQEQMKQNLNQEVEYTSGFLEEEVVNESEFDDPTGEQKAGKLADNQQKKPEEEEHPKKKAKRPRKTIEQEIAELDAKRERLMEKKRKQEAHEKIVFGATVIAMLKNMKEINDKNYELFCEKILMFAKIKRINGIRVIEKIIKNI